MAWVFFYLHHNSLLHSQCAPLIRFTITLIEVSIFCNHTSMLVIPNANCTKGFRTAMAYHSRSLIHCVEIFAVFTAEVGLQIFCVQNF